MPATSLFDTATLRGQLGAVVRLSIPAVLAQLSSTAMQYIDATMVGSLGANASAAIGLVASTTWLLGGLCSAAATGFSVQVAHRIGAGDDARARAVVRQAAVFSLWFGLLLAALGVAISAPLPVWLGGAADIRPDAAAYFFIYACALPALLVQQMFGMILQCSGDMRTPSVLNVLMCVLDVIFNAFLIFPGFSLGLVRLPGAGMGVAGAALGTALAQAVVALLMLWAVLFRAPRLRHVGGSWRPDAACLRTAARIAIPAAVERVTLSAAQIAATRIVSPLGTIAVAANSLAVTAESLCYMPGYGISAAATTLVGQSLGAGHKGRARRFAWLSTALGMAVMGLTAVLMYAGAPWLFRILTPDATVRALGVQVLRIEAFAEPLFAASIVAAGALRGAGDTLVPSVLNLVSMWGVRITLAAVLAPQFGLPGVWFAMCFELCVRGVLFLVRLLRGRWLQKARL